MFLNYFINGVSMKLSDEFEDQDAKKRLPMLYMTIGVIAFISLVFVVVLCVNLPKNSKKSESVTLTDILTNTGKEEEKRDPILDELGVGESTLTSDELDFWNMYKDDESLKVNGADKSELTKEERIEKNAEALLEQEKEEEPEDLSENGTKTKVIRPDGSEQWVMINAYITKNDYKKEGFVYEEPIMKYYLDGEKLSTLGVVLNEDCGNVDFSLLKKAGVEYVMLRVGYRGYETGNLSLDSRFDEYDVAAKQAGIKVGAYFESQAISVEEAEEEAQLVVGNLMERSIAYPVAIKLGVVKNDTSRTDNLTKGQITDITNQFCKYVEDCGYRGMVFGSKYWLLRRLDLTLLGQYDIWLSQDEEVPDYPYQFDFWQYQNSAKIDGVSCEVPLCISFVDYSKK